MKKLHNSIALLASVCIPAVFDPGKPGWKLDTNGNIELKDGNPVYVNANGEEMTVGSDTISRTNAEAKSNRERAERAEAELKKFEKIKDPEAAIKAIETVSKLDAKQLIDAGEVDKVKESIKSEFTTQIAERDKRISELEENNNSMLRSNAFKSSEFIRERVAIPAEFFENQYSKNFKVEDGKLVPYGPDGNKVFSKKRIGEVANLDEALEILVENSPWKDQILKAPDASGSGNGGAGGSRGGSRVVKRADYDKLSPAEKAKTAEEASKGELQIVD